MKQVAYLAIAVFVLAFFLDVADYVQHPRADRWIHLFASVAGRWPWSRSLKVAVRTGQEPWRYFWRPAPGHSPSQRCASERIEAFSAIDPRNVVLPSGERILAAVASSRSLAPRIAAAASSCLPAAESARAWDSSTSSSPSPSPPSASSACFPSIAGASAAAACPASSS